MYEPTKTIDGRPPGTYRVTNEGYQVLVEAFFRLSDTTGTFTMRYRALGAAKRWSDTAELYWKYIGATWDVPMDDVRVTIALPEGVTRDEVRAWAHGPLYGTVTIEPDASVVLAVSPLPAQTMVEARVTFPAEALPGATQINQPRLELILAEEQEWADEANAERDALEKQQEKVRRGRWAAVALALVIWIPFLFLYFRYGREHEPSLPGEYFRDIPAELPPAIVSYLWTMGGVPPSAVTATIVDLANRGVVRIEAAAADDASDSGKNEPTYRLTLDTTKTEGLDQIDSDLLGFLFTMVAGDTTLTIPEMRDYAKANQKEFREGLAAWHKTVTTRAEQLGFMEKAGQTASGCMVGLAVVVWIAGPILSVAFETVWPLIAGIASGIAVLIASRALKRRTREAAELHAKYRGLRNYMRDFGRMKEKPPTAVVLWEQYLVLAIVFGIADQVIKDMHVVVPEVVNDPAFRTGMWYMFAADQGMSGFGSAFDSGFAAAASAASPKSSGSGGGGGFSGGGGGGGGGMGGGAD